MFGFLTFCLTLFSIIYYGLCIYAAKRFFSGPEPERWQEAPPATIMIPLCGTDFEAYENHASFCRQRYPLFQILFGVRDLEDPAIPVVRKLMSDFPRVDIDLVIGTDTIGQNPKVDNLHNLLHRAKHELIVLVDSDIRVSPDYLSDVTTPLRDREVGMVTCLYRVGKTPSFAARLEAVGITAEFAPGVLVAWLTEGISFALGATVVMRKKDLEAIGGFQAVADYLADDYMLGNLMRKAGYEVRLSSHIVQTLHPPLGFASMLKHQIRWSRGIRACRPMGHLGSLLTHGTVLSLLNLVVHRASEFSLFLFTAACLARCIMAWVVGVRFLKDPTLERNLWLLPVRDCLSFFVWCASLLGKDVVWRGKTFRIVEDGKMMPSPRAEAKG